MLENLDQHIQRAHCKIQRINAELTAEDVALLTQYLGDEDKWSHYHLTKALNKAGITLSETVIRRHRAKECACWRT